MILIKLVFLHDMAYGRYKDLNKRIELDKVLRDKAFKVASNPKRISFNDLQVS